MADLYDEQTGHATLEHQAAEEAILQSEELSEADAVAQMAATQGWQITQKWLLDLLDGCKEKLIDTNDMSEVVRFQQSARAYSNVLGRVLQMTEKARVMKETAATKP